MRDVETIAIELSELASNPPLQLSDWTQNMSDFDRQAAAPGIYLNAVRNRTPDAIRRGKMLESRIAGVRLMAKLEMHRAGTGEWPETLLDVMDAIDARDPVSGDVFVYERSPKNQDGRPYEIRIPWIGPSDEGAVVNRKRNPIK